MQPSAPFCTRDERTLKQTWKVTILCIQDQKKNAQISHMTIFSIPLTPSRLGGPICRTFVLHNVSTRSHHRSWSPTHLCVEQTINQLSYRMCINLIRYLVNARPGISVTFLVVGKLRELVVIDKSS